VAALTILSQSETEPPNPQHINIATGFEYSSVGLDDRGIELGAMAQNGQSTDRKRVKVYELRNNDWFDRGTGFCTAAFVPVSRPLYLFS
jgi:protein phosphatase 4 regulatory subunit 3